MFWAAFSPALPVPRHAWLNPVLCLARSGQVAFTPPAHHAIVTGSSVTPFVCALRPGPPVTRTRPLNCLAQVAFGRCPDGSGLRRDPTWGTLIKVRPLKHRRTTPAPDTTPAATLLARLFLSFTTA